MAKLMAKKEHEWVERVRSEGAVPHLQPNNCSYGWTSPPGNVFFVRGPEYLKTKVKVPGGDYLLKPLGFDWIKGPTRISELLNNPKNRVRRALEEECSKGHKPFVWAFNLQVPSKDNYSAVAYFVATEPSQEDSLISRFLRGDEGFMTSRLKMIANIAKGPWIVRKAVGEQAICIIGRSLSSKYCIGRNFIEVDIDIGSSMVATAVVHLAFGYLTTLTVDLAFLIEGQSESELPEKILGAIRFSELDVASARNIELTSEDNMGSVPSSLPTRLWKSVGQRISIVLPSARESGSNLSASYVNRAVDDNRSSGDVNRQ